jgi:hypothetical protein
MWKPFLSLGISLLFTTGFYHQMHLDAVRNENPLEMNLVKNVGLAMAKGGLFAFLHPIQ